MNRERMTTIGHTHFKLCSPLSDARLSDLIQVLNLAAPERVLDLGAGKAEIILRVLEQVDGTGVAVERNAAFVNDARADAEKRLGPSRLDVLHGDAAQFETEEQFDLVMCVGARPFGDQQTTLRRLIALTRPGGQLLVGEGYWRDRPDDAYLQFLGESDADGAIRFEDHMTLASAEGLQHIFACASTIQEFEFYDGMYGAAIEAFGREHPQDPEVDKMLEYIRSWRTAFLRWGRTTMGFGWYLYQKPSAT